MEINTDIKSQSSANTPESSSNSTTATNSTKITKADYDDEIKIQVLDDCMDMVKQFKQINNFGYDNRNFNYSGSYRSMGSSYESGDDTNKKIENDQGLYSVKNASIQFQNQSDSVSPQKDTDFYACVPEHNQTDLAYHSLLVNSSANDAQMHNMSKTSSLKKLKKDLAVKRGIYSSVNEAKIKNTLSIKTPNDVAVQLNFDASGSFSFVNANNDMLFSPNDMFASVV